MRPLEKLSHKLGLLILIGTAYLTFLPQTYTYQSDVQVISPADYFQTALDAINNAKESVFVVMYYISWDPFKKESKPYRLVQSLIEAHKRGLEVNVILDQTMDISAQQDETIDDWQLLKAKNITVYELLQREGIDVSFDSPSINTHSKVIIIDNQTTLLGSSNWTETALNSNNESNLLIKSKLVAQDLLDDFKDLKLQTPNIITSDSNIKLSFKFLQDPKLLASIAATGDELTLDVYLELLRYADKDTSTTTISYQKLIDDIGLTSSQARSLINRAFNKLKDKYKLIHFDKEAISYKDTVTLTLTPLEDNKHIELPLIYFTYNWHKTLSSRAKVMYLVTLAYYTISDSKPWFFVSREQIQSQFHLTLWYISSGMQQLRRQNIIDIRYSKLTEESQTPRLANHYKVLGLYDPKRQDERFKELSLRYGEANVQRMRSYAKSVYKENDTETIQVLLQYLTDYGEEHIKKAVTIVSKKRPDNPKRNLSYLLGIVETSYKESQ